jgi:hypothetical protein
MTGLILVILLSSIASIGVVAAEPLPEQEVLFVTLHGGSYDYSGYADNMYRALVDAGANATKVDLDTNGKVADLISSNHYDQIWVWDLSSDSDNYQSDWQAIADWYNSSTSKNIIADGRILSSYSYVLYEVEGRNLTENYYYNLKVRGGGLLLGTDHGVFQIGINEINKLIGLNPFIGIFALQYIPIDTQNPLMNTPNDMGIQLNASSSPGQTPHGLQPNGQILYTVAWFPGNPDMPGISSTIHNLPPITAITLSGTEGLNGWYTSDVQVTLTATDDDSDISSTEYSFDNTIWTTYTDPFTISTEGTTIVYYRSTDNAGGVETTQTSAINIDKTLPSISITTPVNYELYVIGEQMSFSATDETSGIATVIGTLTSTIDGSSTVSSPFSPDPGVYTLTVTAEDKAGNTVSSDPVFFIVYDPDGGHATGGGWFYPDSESSLSGDYKATFGFVAKYKAGSSTGNLEFQYHDPVNGINLKSKTIDWLTISEVSAIFQGTGTINGEEGYTFRVIAKDSGESGNGDYFDIKIWDNPDTETLEPIHKAKNYLEGGNIIVHKK